MVVPIVFVSDNNYVPYAATAIQSIKAQASAKDEYFIYVLHDSLAEENQRLIMLANTKAFSVECIDISEKTEKFIQKLYVHSHFTREMYYRWFIPELFPQYDRILYLDCDLVANSNLAVLIGENLENKPIGAVYNILNTTNRRRVQEKVNLKCDNYVNSGVLLFDTVKFTEQNILSKCFELATNANTAHLGCPDQDILNIVCENNIHLLPDEYNVQWHHLWDSENELNGLEYERFIRSLANMKILHFTSGVKPWFESQKRMAYYFWQHAVKTPFFSMILTEGKSRYAAKFFNQKH